MPQPLPLESLRNIGSTVAERLREIGIRTRVDLARVGPVRAYWAMKRRRL